MPLAPQKFREALLQILYSSDFGSEEEIIPFMMKELKAARGEMREAFKRAEEVRESFADLDSIIAAVSKEYRLERISKVELSILRLGLYELLFDGKVPETVAISEAIRLCRKFGTPESSQFINAILQEIWDARNTTKSKSV